LRLRFRFELEFVDGLFRDGFGMWHHQRAAAAGTLPRAARGLVTDRQRLATRRVRATELDRHCRLVRWRGVGPLGRRPAALANYVGLFGTAQSPASGGAVSCCVHDDDCKTARKEELFAKDINISPRYRPAPENVWRNRIDDLPEVLCRSRHTPCAV